MSDNTTPLLRTMADHVVHPNEEAFYYEECATRDVEPVLYKSAMLPKLLVGLAAARLNALTVGWKIGESAGEWGFLFLVMGIVFFLGLLYVIGGLGHALPYLIPSFWTATTLAIIIVFIELWAIAWIQNRYMETPFFRAAFQVVLGGALVFAAGVLIGSG